MSKPMTYDETDLAKTAIRNYEEAKKNCGDKQSCADPVECVARVFRAPLDTLSHAEAQRTEALAKLNRAEFALEYVKVNLPDADKLIAQAHEEFTTRAVSAGLSPHDRN